MTARKALLRASVACGIIAATAVTPAAASAQPMAYQIRDMSLSQALREYARISGRQIIFTESLVRRRRAPALVGVFTPEDALTRLLVGSGLRAQVTPAGAIMIERGPEATPGSGEPEAGGAAADSESADAGATPEILVIGSRSQNVDIRRTENDPQPYVVFNRREIENSNSTNLEEFVRTRLPMNAAVSAANQGFDGSGISNTNISSISLRGLGANQTLILVDGRRSPRVLGGAGNLPTQADINGIPLAAIERIEVLPSTAGGIYGGGAVGGVINIIRRRDYNGIDVRLGYEGAIRGGGETFRADITGGFTPDGGTTQISFSMSHAASRPLYARDNDLWRRGRNLYLANLGNFSPALQASLLFPGSTANIISSTGAELVLDNGTPLGSSRTFVPPGYAGVQSDNGAALLANVGSINEELSTDARGGLLALRNNPRVQSLNLNVRREFGRNVDAYLDLNVQDNLGRSRSNVTAIANLQANAPNNPFRQTVTVYYPVPGLDRIAEARSLNYGIAGGVIGRWGSNWTSVLQYEWNRQRVRTTGTVSPFLPTAATTMINNGSIDITRDLNVFPLDLSAFQLPDPNTIRGPYEITQQVVSGRISGELAPLPGGALTLTGLLEYRSEQADDAVNLTVLTGSRSVIFARSQGVESGYLELRAPIFSGSGDRPFLEALELQASLRHDRYRTVVANPATATLAAGAPFPTLQENAVTERSTNYTLAARWAPFRDVSFRTSYATGFLPPAINQLVPISGNCPALADPNRGGQPIGTVAACTNLGGGNPSLKPERSRSWSLGVVLTPQFIRGLRISADYTRIRRLGQIGNLNFNFLFANEDLFPGRVVRGARLPTDPAGWLGPITSLDSTFANIDRSNTEAFDFQADYGLEIGRFGRIDFYAVATRQTVSEQELVASSTAFDTVGFAEGPLKWRGNAGYNWALGNFELGWNVQYYSGYSVRFGSTPTSSGSNNAVIRQGAERIPGQSYHDLVLRYRFDGNALSILSGFDLTVGIQNVFDRRPPVIAAQINGYSPYGDPRLRRYSLSLRRHF